MGFSGSECLGWGVGFRMWVILLVVGIDHVNFDRLELFVLHVIVYEAVL